MMQHNALWATLLVSVSLSSLASVASADSKPAAAKKAPTDERLAQLVGRWEGKSEFKLQGKASTWNVTSSCERAAISPAIVCSAVAVSGDMRLEEMWMFGYDDHSATYHLFMTNDWGEAYDHAAKWTDTASVAFIHMGTRDGKKLVENYTLSFKPDQMIWKGSLKVGDKLVGDGTTTLQRVK